MRIGIANDYADHHGTWYSKNAMTRTTFPSESSKGKGKHFDLGNVPSKFHVRPKLLH